MRFLVTGSTGKLGKAICLKLIENGHFVTGCDLTPSDIKHESYHHIVGDIKDKSSLINKLNAIDCIIHSAVYKGDYDRNLPAAFDTNVLGTLNLYECAREKNVAKIILLSSAPVDKPFPVNNPFDWQSNSGSDHLYDLTKRLQEEIANDYFETFQFNTLVLRLGHIVNGRLNTDLESNSLKDVKYCLGGWVDLEDAAEAIFLGTQYDHSSFEILNIIGSETKQDPFDIKQTIAKLGWNPIHRFKNAII